MSADVEHLTCKEFVEVLTDYLENALDPTERAEIERHIVICRGCSNYVEQMRSTISLLGRLADEDGTGDGDGDVAVDCGKLVADRGRLVERVASWDAGRRRPTQPSTASSPRTPRRSRRATCTPSSASGPGRSPGSRGGWLCSAAPGAPRATLKMVV